jgi:hypothetical protein
LGEALAQLLVVSTQLGEMMLTAARKVSKFQKDLVANTTKRPINAGHHAVHVTVFARIDSRAHALLHHLGLMALHEELASHENCSQRCGEELCHFALFDWLGRTGRTRK